MLRRFLHVSFLTCLFVSAMSCTKQGTVNPTPAVEEEIVTESVSEDIQYIKWTPELNIPDPVSISMDDRGRAYVTQTQRRKAQDLDIRQNLDWVPDDVGLETIEDKRRFLKAQLSAETSEANKARVDDHNGDGVHDWRDLAVLPEIIHIVEDTDGDGFADSSKVFDDDFKTEVTGIGAGVLWHDGDVYATVAPDVWKLRDTDGDDHPDLREIIATGFGLHIAYAGHDMHGLTVGPDGKIYWTIGDKGASVVSKEGKRFHFPNQGAMLRCNPDGSDFEVFAHGLRNVQEPVFDAYGNWFGVDNDSDQEGELERFMYIVEGMDAGWRCNFQYRGDEYNPWLAEGMTVPKHDGQPAYILPTIQNYIDGPAGFTWNPGTALNDRYKDFFFLNGTLNGAQYAFQVEPDGASFRMVNDHQIGEGIPLIGLTWGNDGALYSVDWGGDYPLNQTGAIWKLDTPGANEAMRRETQGILEQGVKQRSLDQLRELLAHPDQRIRLKAQFELVNRSESAPLIEDSTHNLTIKRIHAIWGLGQLARDNDQAAIEQLVSLMNDSDPEIQVQTSKMLADLKSGSMDGKLFIPHLGSENPRVRFQAGLSVARQKVTDAFDAVIALIENNNGADSYLRHAGIMALTGTGGADTLANHPSEEVRLCAVVALRRLNDPKIVDFLGDKSEYVVLEAVRAIHDDFAIPEALPAVANMLTGTTSDNEALVRRLINANFRIGGFNEAYLVAEYAANDRRSTAMRLEALDALAAWKEPPPLDRVDGRRRYFDPRPIAEIASGIGSFLEQLLDSESSAIVEKAVVAANQLSISLSSDSLGKLLRNNSAPSSLRVAALKSLQNPSTITYAQNSTDEGLRMAAAEFLTTINPGAATQYLIKRLDRSNSIAEKQQTLALLAGLETELADQAIRSKARELSQGTIEPALQLDIIEAATQRNMVEELAGFESSRPTGSEADYIEALEGGHAEAGKKVVQTHLAAQCIRCHRFGRESGSEIGPNLRRIGQNRDREYLLRSLVDPNADIAEGYGLITVMLRSGKAISGQLGTESQDGIQLLMPDGTEQFVETINIVSRTEPLSSMPPMGLLMTKRELRDVVEYLVSLK